MRSTFFRQSSVAAAVVILSACSVGTDSIDGSISQDRLAVESLRLAVQTSPAIDRSADLRRVRVPVGGEWLAEDIGFGLRGNADPVSAINALIGDHPVVYQLVGRIPNIRVNNSQSANTVMDHLDTVTFQANWLWEFIDGVVIIKDWITKNVPVTVLPGTRSFNLGIDSLGNSDSLSSPGQNIINGFNNPHQKLSEAIEALGFTLGDQTTVISPVVMGFPGDESGSESLPIPTYTVLEYGGTVVLRGSPRLVHEAERVVDRFNAGHLGRGVIEITIYEITFSESSNRSLDVNLLRNSASAWGFDLSNDTAALSGVGSAGLSFNVDSEDNRLFGSNATLQWLNRHGETSTRLHRRLELTHGEVSTIRDVEIIPYVEEVTIQDSNQGSTTRSTPSVKINQITVGYVLHILPSILPGSNSMNLRINLSRASHVDSLQFSFSNDAISGEIPIVAQQDDVLSISLDDGQISIVSSATLTDRRSNLTTTPLLPVLGDAVDGSENRSEIVMLISAVVEDY